MQIGFYFDQTRCTGCGTCQVACKDWHDLPAGPENWMRVLYTERGKFPDVFVSYLISPCYQCLDPVCVPACPVDAISKREEDGVVVVDSQACLGNEECDVKCLKACPYDALNMDKEQEVAKKCTFCEHRIEQSHQPACAAACNTGAIIFGNTANPKSTISKRIREIDDHCFFLKPEEGTVPSIRYLKFGKN